MKRPRFSIGKLMVFVGLIALNLGAGRVLLSSPSPLLAGFIPAGLMFEWGAFRLIRTRLPARAFWAGFLAIGLMASFSLAWAMSCGTSVNLGLDQVSGQRVRIVVPGSPSADRVWSWWKGYFDRAVSRLVNVPLAERILARGDGAASVLIAAILFSPQLIIAVSGGFLASLLARIVGRGYRRGASANSP